jgi:hypothetical protein
MHLNSSSLYIFYRLCHNATCVSGFGMKQVRKVPHAKVGVRGRDVRVSGFQQNEPQFRPGSSCLHTQPAKFDRLGAIATCAPRVKPPKLTFLGTVFSTLTTTFALEYTETCSTLDNYTAN